MDSEFELLGSQLLKCGFLDIKGLRQKDWPRERLSELLVYLASCGGTEWIRPICQLGADINYVNDEGATALSNCIHARVEVGPPPHVDTFHTAIELLAEGADPNSTYLSMFSVTHLAVQLDQPDFVALFLLSGARLDAEEPDSQTTDTLKDVLMRPQSGTGSDWPQRLLWLRLNSKS